MLSSKRIKNTLQIAVFGIILLGGSIDNLQAQLPGTQFDPHPMHWARYWARGLFDRNLVYLPMWNIGNLGDAGLTPGEGLSWPGSTSGAGLNYGGTFNFYIGAYVTDMTPYRSKVVPEDRDGIQFPILTDTHLAHVSTSAVAAQSKNRDHQQIWAPLPGYFNDGYYGFIWGINEDTNKDGALTPDEDVNYNGILDLNLDPPESILKQMAISTDKRTWPMYWPGGSYIKDTRPPAGRPPRTTEPGLREGRWNGEYKSAAIADQETLYMMDDHENDAWNEYWEGEYFPFVNPDGTPDTTTWKDGGMLGAGIEVEARSYAWFHPLAEDLVVSVYRVRNYSDHTLNRVVTGMYADANVGRSGYNAADYKVAEFGATDEGRLEFDILYQWQKFPDELDTYKKIGVFGFAFLESPGIEYNGEDDDRDGIIDESLSDGIDNDHDWRPFADTGLPDIPGTEGNGKWDTEDTNLNGALDPGEDINKNDRLDYEEVNDDRGSDGIGPDENSWPGPDPNGSETNGIVDPGEPNFDSTDIDEADQAGLKHVYVYETNKDLKDDKKFWTKYLAQEGTEVQDTDEGISFTFGAKNVRLETINELEEANRPSWKRFAIALIMGGDNDDAVRNKSTMQSIYNNNYRFLTPPLQPTLIANAFDGVIRLYWDKEAEKSLDPFYGEDFNGYRLYKSTDPKFLDLKTISDAFGNVLLFKPIEIFDKADGLKGEHPIPFPNLGVHYDMGSDSGLKHSYEDTLVDNGRTYFYAVSSIDAGNDWDFFDRGIVTKDYPLAAMPSESGFNITVNNLGEVVYRDRNTAVVVPSEPAAGYVDPHVDSLRIEHVSGFAQGGRWNIDVYNRSHATDHLNNVYELSFTDDGWLNALTPDYDWGSTTGITCVNKTSGDTMFSYHYETAYDFQRKAFPLIESGIFDGINYDLAFPMNPTDEDKGISIIKYNAQGRSTNEWKKWATETNCNLRVEAIELTGSALALPFDFEIRVEDHMGADTSYSDSFLTPSYPLNFTTWNVTDPNNPHRMKVKVVYDKNKNLELPEEMYGQIWDSTRVTIFFPKYEEDKYWASWQVRFFKNRYDSLNATIPPSPGDVYRFRTERNPARLDTFRYAIEGGVWEKEVAKEDMRDIFVVPDPYVVTNSFEPIYELGGTTQRRVDFVNLPPKCTIHIFTASGKKVRTLEHESSVDYGRKSWDLTSDDGPEVAFGIYFFVVEAPDIGTKRGKFALIK
ncbi:MAG: hypothetical protein H6696_08655 [Deferribacteres bacterium]|nr:hypothetical protein [candidate division KSB1 bacterium]MCB9501994.1 hypothetical protein [Deferribacteres bacterium]